VTDLIAPSESDRVGKSESIGSPVAATLRPRQTRRTRISAALIGVMAGAWCSCCSWCSSCRREIGQGLLLHLRWIDAPRHRSSACHRRRVASRRRDRLAADLAATPPPDHPDQVLSSHHRGGHIESRRLIVRHHQVIARKVLLHLLRPTEHVDARGSCRVEALPLSGGDRSSPWDPDQRRDQASCLPRGCSLCSSAPNPAPLCASTGLRPSTVRTPMTPNSANKLIELKARNHEEHEEHPEVAASVAQVPSFGVPDGIGSQR
jgi:hypothetical protein